MPPNFFKSRYCNAQYYVNLAGSYASLNYAAMAEQVMRPSVATFMYFKPIMEKYNAAKEKGDFYGQGLAFASLWKYLFDGSTNN